MAHGAGIAVSLDGDFVVAEGRFVLGQFVAGELIEIPPNVPRTKAVRNSG
jgi:hypothetical protein